jgi:hypothetical protein
MHCDEEVSLDNAFALIEQYPEDLDGETRTKERAARKYHIG